MRRDGFSLLELILATVIGAIILGVSVSLVLSNRKVYDLDRARTELNQNLRSALDLMGSDIRLAGERLPPDFPALAFNQPEGLLVVRTARTTTALTLCEDLLPADNSLLVAQDSSTLCPRTPVSPTDTRHSPLVEFETERTRGGGTQIAAFIYDPTTACNDTSKVSGEFVVYTAANNPATGNVELLRSGPSLSRSYPRAHTRIYLLQQRSYSLQNGLLSLSINAGLPQGVANNIASVQISARRTSSSTAFTSMCESSGAWVRWKDLMGVDLSLSGSIRNRTSTIERSLSGQYVPRNVLSQ